MARVWVEPRSCDQGRRKNAIITITIYYSIIGLMEVDLAQSVRLTPHAKFLHKSRTFTSTYQMAKISLT